MSRKKDEKRKKLSKAEKRLKRKSGQAILLDRVSKSDLIPKPNLVLQNYPVQKMSEVIISYAKPMLDAAGSYKNKKSALALAIIFWNLSFLPDQDRKEGIEKLLPNLCPHANDEELQERRDFVSYFIQRKESLFPDNERLILDYEITDTTYGFHLDVVSTVPRLEMKANRPQGCDEPG